MDQVCLVLPVRPGKSEAARDFLGDLDRDRRGDYDVSERRIGISKEAWFIAPGSTGQQLVGYMESADFAKALGMFVESKDPFDQWFKERLLDATGFDLNQMPTGPMPELISSYAV